MIEGNTAKRDGGGIYCDESSPAIENNTISDNSAYYGGGIYCEDSSPSISNNTISDNSATYAGGIYCDESSPAIENNMISDNSAAYGGGISCCWSGSPTIRSNTITGNSAEQVGGGIYCYESSPTIMDCIIWGNGDDLLNCSTTYCCIQDDDGGEGNIHEDPMFVIGPLGEYYLHPDSPCIEAGSRSAAEAGLSDRTTQADGTPDTGTVDMGFHYPVP